MKRWHWLFVTAWGVIAVPVHAQTDAAQSADEQQADEIIVTGQKQSRSLQDTPASVGVTTAEDIADRNLIDIYDALAQTANVAVPANKQSFSIRGIDAFNVSGAGYGALASVYLDGAALPKDAVLAGPLDLFDIDQIEIYRGPQSTLQGRNALAGAVIIRTAEPSFDWSGRFRAQMTDQDGGRRFAAALGGPLIEDQLAFRASGEIARADGLVYGINIHDDFDQRKSETVRAKLLFTPTALPGLRIVASYMHDRHTRGESYVEFDSPYEPTDRVLLFNDPTGDVTKTDLWTLNASYAFDRQLTLNAVTTYGRTKRVNAFDQDFSEADVGFVTNIIPTRTFSQEVRLNFDFGRLQGLVGGYYSDENAKDTHGFGTQRILFSTVGLDRQLVAPPPAGFGLDQATANYVMDLYPGRGVQIDTNIATPLAVTNKALFADADWEFADGIKLLAGFRWDNEQQDRAVTQLVTLATQLPDPAAMPVPALGQLVAGINNLVRQMVSDANNVEPASTTKFEAFLPKVGLSWQVTPDVMLSGVVQRGYRSGGSNTNLARARYYTYDPEYTWNYELALRTEWFDRKLTLNANLFHIDWKDQQVSVELTPGNSYDTETRNAGRSRLWGFEVEARGRPTRTLTLSAGVGYTRTKFIDFMIDTGNAAFIATGNEFGDAPRWTLNGSATWHADNGLFANVNANYRSAAFVSQLEQTERDIDARALVNARIGWRGEHFGAFLFATNLFDEYYVQSSFVTGGRRKGLIGDPRTVGISLEGKF